MQFEHLILLIGTNPLPNFVVAEYFLKYNVNLKNLYLVYSEERDRQMGTLKYTENLQNLIKNRHRERNLKFIHVPLSNISRASDIARDVRGNLLKKLPANIRIHLNYTGGTKAMVVHIYRLIEGCKDEFSQVSFSYLDARDFKIVQDEGGVISGDLREEIKMDIKEMIGLHGFEKINEADCMFHQAVDMFKSLIDKGEVNEYFNVYDRTLFTQKDNKDKPTERKSQIKDNSDKLLERKSQIKDELKNFKAKEPLLSIVRAMPEEYRLFHDNGSFREPETNRHLERAVEFLDGKWLEQYVYDVLRRNFRGDNIFIDANWKIRAPDWRSHNQRFELDVILIKGYQLIGISCTTSHKKHLCKGKGFEITLRVRQIGGEEARAILITGLKNDKRDEIQDELSVDTGGEKNILVLGQDDLKEEWLINKIEDFIK